ncbi:MAG TPA: hypothetical protein VNX28_09245, partial [Gemmataceae bacterium]|nr:hypothetical protein [Gemmataceae bacterium]
CLPPGMNFKIYGDGVAGPNILGPEVKPHYEPSLRRVPRDADAAGARMSYPREFDVSLNISQDAELGMRCWRVSGAWGGTQPRPFFVGDLPEFIETEPNSRPELAERVTLPVVVNGQIAGERDQDFFVFAAREGEVVVCDVMAARIGSPLEPVVAITGPSGKRQEIDEIRVGNDPVLAFRAPTTGDYRLHIANISYYGGPAYVYRITLSTRPYAAFAFPPGARAGTTREVDVFMPTGAGSLRSVKEKVVFPAQPGSFRLRDNLFLVAGELPETLATTDNLTLRSAPELTLPVTVSGRFLKADAEHWFRLSAQKDATFTITCQPASQASAAVPLLTIYDVSGTPLARASSAETPDRGLEMDWKAPGDGTYHLRVRDLQHGSSGGPEFIYRLTVQPARPSFSLRLDTDCVNIVQGGKKEIDVLVRRSGGFTGPIDLTASGLPDGVQLENARIAERQTRIKLSLAAKTDTRPSDAVVRLVGTAMHLGNSLTGKTTVSSFGRESDALHMTVQHRPVFRLSCSEAYQYAPCGTIHPYRMKVERLDGFQGPIVLQLCDRQVQDLDGVEILETVIPADAKEVMNLIYFPETMHAGVQAHSRPYAQAYATFIDKWGQKQVLLSVSTHRCMVRTLPPVVKLRALNKEIAARPGEVVECTLALDRNSIFTGPAEVVLKDTAGIKADGVRLEPGQSEAVLHVHLSKDWQHLEERVLQFRATGRLESGDTAVTEAAVTVKMN